MKHFYSSFDFILNLTNMMYIFIVLYIYSYVSKLARLHTTNAIIYWFIIEKSMDDLVNTHNCVNICLNLIGTYDHWYIHIFSFLCVYYCVTSLSVYIGHVKQSYCVWLYNVNYTFHVSNTKLIIKCILLWCKIYINSCKK